MAWFHSELSVGAAGRMYANTPYVSKIYQTKRNEWRNSKVDKAKGFVKISAGWCLESIY
jgi:hypothetical protein